jgi:hypothetical protein
MVAHLKEKCITTYLDVFLGIIKNCVVPKLESLAEWYFNEGAQIRHLYACLPHAEIY